MVKTELNTIQCPLCGEDKDYAIFFTDSNDGYARCKEKEVWEQKMKDIGLTILSSVRNDDKRFSAWYDFQILAQKKSSLIL